VFEEDRQGGGVNPPGKHNTRFAKAASEFGNARRRFTLESLCVKAPLTGDDEIGSSNHFS
jgi:hypothetical protein